MAPLSLTLATALASHGREKLLLEQPTPRASAPAPASAPAACRRVGGQLPSTPLAELGGTHAFARSRLGLSLARALWRLLRVHYTRLRLRLTRNAAVGLLARVSTAPRAECRPLRKLRLARRSPGGDARPCAGLTDTQEVRKPRTTLIAVRLPQQRDPHGQPLPTNTSERRGATQKGAKRREILKNTSAPEFQTGTPAPPERGRRSARGSRCRPRRPRPPATCSRPGTALAEP